VCVCDNTVIWIVFYVVRAGLLFYFRLVVNKISNKWRPVERNPCSTSTRDFCFWHILCVPPSPPRSSSLVFEGLYITCACQLRSFE
jgi:hypothetical protein